MAQIDDAKRKSKKKRMRSRKKKLQKLVEEIESGDFNSEKAPKDLLFNQKTPRQQYVSPGDRSTYNYGYMEIDEMLAGTPNIWR